MREEKLGQRSVHNEVKAKVYRNILLNRLVTVGGLSSETGLRPDQIYPILAKLRKLGFLTTKSIPDRRKSAHRPNQLYTLSDDLNKRKRLAAEIAPFLQLSRESLSRSDALDRLDLRLSDITRSVQENIPNSFDTSTISHLESYLDVANRALKELAVLKDDLEIAWYECNRSYQHPLYRDFKRAQNNFETLSTRVADLRDRLDVRFDELNAERQFSDIVRRSFPQASGIGALEDVQQRLRAEYHSSTNLHLRSILSAVFARVTFAAEYSRGDSAHRIIGRALGEACARFGSDAGLFLEWISQLEMTQMKGVVTTYDTANASLLSKADSRAIDLWKQFILRQDLVAGLGGLKELSIYSGATILTGDIGDLGKHRLAEVEDRLGLQGAYSMATTAPIDIFGTAYVIKPTIPDWLEPESDGFILSLNLRANQDNLFAYGPLANIVHFSGLPRVRLATALVRLGGSVDVAWRVAETLKAGKVLLVLHLPRAADLATVGGIQRILPGFKVEESYISDASENVAAASAVKVA